MLDKPPLVLKDGTTLNDLIDLEMNEVTLRVMNDAELYQLEMQRIYARTWLMLGHQSEIPNSGDFVVRDMGEDNVILSRANDGRIHVSLNVCAHRGVRVCRAEAGNTQVHRCFYHGWAYRANGDFIGAPVEREQMHGSKRAKAELGMKQARVELYAGMIFATWNVDGPSLDDFLGESKFYLDQVFARTDSGLELLGPPQRFVVPANWKTAGDQSASDGFHVLTLHRWMLEDGLLGGDEGTAYDAAPSMISVDVSFDNGHSLRCLELHQTFKRAANADLEEKSTEERLHIMRPPGLPAGLVSQTSNNLSSEQLDMLATSPPGLGNIFPNIVWLAVYTPRDDGGETGVISLHTYIPKGPDKLEFVNYVFCEKDAPQHVKEEMLQNSVQQLGASGLIEQDDADVLPEMQRSAAGVIGRSSTLKYHALIGENRPEGWTGGGRIHAGFTKDDTQWNWWKNYYDVMSSQI